MAENKEKISKSGTKYKAENPKQFAEMYNDTTPKYNELCKGEPVSLDKGNKIVKDWISNNIIIKEK